MDGQTGTGPQVRYAQPWRVFARRKLIGAGLVLVVMVGGILAITLMFLFSPGEGNQVLGGWLVPIILTFVVIGFLALSGHELMRTRFAVYEHGFIPPFVTFRQTLRRDSPLVPFSLLGRVDIRHYIRRGETRIDEISTELLDGRRFLVREVDVGLEGLTALLKAAEEYKERVDSGEGPGFRPPAVPLLSVPSWIRRELRLELLGIGLALLAIVLIFVLLLLTPGLVSAGWRILVPLIVLPLLVPFLIYMAYRAWKRDLNLTEKRRQKLLRGSDESESR